MMSDNFAHCPRCSSTQLSFPHEHMMECGSCGFVYIMNTAVAAAGILLDANGRVLLVRRGNNPAKGMWDLPGGFVEPGENTEQGFLRELREELGNIVLTEMKYFGSFANEYPYKDVTYSTVDAVFVCHVNAHTVTLDHAELTGFEWVAPQDIDLESIGLKSIKAAMKEYLQSVNT